MSASWAANYVRRKQILSLFFRDVKKRLKHFEKFIQFGARIFPHIIGIILKRVKNQP